MRTYFWPTMLYKYPALCTPAVTGWNRMERGRVNAWREIKGNSKPSMVLILVGNSETGPQVGRNLSYLICLRHLI